MRLEDALATSNTKDEENTLRPQTNFMFKTNPQEKTILTLRRHWVTYVPNALFAVMFIILYPILTFLPDYYSLPFSIPNQLFWLLGSIFYLFITLYLFISWANYYLDVWIVTDNRIVDIEQIGFFKREISEFQIKKIQDVTVEVSGLLPTFLNFGDVHIQTASRSREFIFRQVPNPYEVKNIVLEIHQKCVRNEL